MVPIISVDTTVCRYGESGPRREKRRTSQTTNKMGSTTNTIAFKAKIVIRPTATSIRTGIPRIAIDSSGRRAKRRKSMVSTGRVLQWQGIGNPNGLSVRPVSIVGSQSQFVGRRPRVRAKKHVRFPIVLEVAFEAHAELGQHALRAEVLRHGERDNR